MGLLQAEGREAKPGHQPRDEGGGGRYRGQAPALQGVRQEHPATEFKDT